MAGPHPAVLGPRLAGLLGFGLEVSDDALSVRNGPIKTHRLPVDEVVALVPARRLGLRLVAVQRSHGKAVRVLASLSRPGHEQPELHLALRRWAARHQVADRLPRAELRASATRASLLAGGEEVSVPCRFRRTTTRGWGPWVEGWLRLREPGSAGLASFVPDNPEQLGLVGAKADQPVPLRAATRIATRNARFREESFEGSVADIVVVTAERHVTELALHPRELDLVAARLEEIVTG